MEYKANIVSRVRPEEDQGQVLENINYSSVHFFVKRIL